MQIGNKEYKIVNFDRANDSSGPCLPMVMETGKSNSKL